MAKEIDIKLRTNADTSGLTKMKNSLSAFRKGVIFSFSDSLVKGIGSALKSGFRGVVKTISSSFKFESQTMQFKSLIGSLEEAKKHMQAAGLRQSHSNTRSKPHLRPTPQLTATLDP